MPGYGLCRAPWLLALTGGHATGFFFFFFFWRLPRNTGLLSSKDLRLCHDQVV